MINLEPIKARTKAATPGPWTSTGNMVFRVGTDIDAKFCAHAREDIPLLLGEVERLRVVLGERGQYTNRTTEALIADRDKLRAEVERLRIKLREGNV